MLIDRFAKSELIWLPEQGIGYFPVTESPYDAEYFERIQKNSGTNIGLALNAARVKLVNEYTRGEVLDIGIGSGAFLARKNPTFGYDINPVAVEWLRKHRLYREPWAGADSMTFWDSLEHIHDPTEYLMGCREYAFVSCPIYQNAEHILRSKHFRKDEHCWYWTEEGICRFMAYFSFELVEYNDMETQIGREDIGTFVFKRKQSV
jgi:hypothetical protein